VVPSQQTYLDQETMVHTMAKLRIFIFTSLLFVTMIACVSRQTVVKPLRITEKTTASLFRQGLWIRAVSTASPEAISRIIEVVNQMKITDVFVQVVVGGYAYYNSNLLPRSQYLSEISGQDYDPLDSLTRVFADTPVRIHAWVNVLLYWSLSEPPESPNHILYTHPDWFIHDVNRVSMANYSYTQWKNMHLEGLYLDPENPEVVSFIQKICAEIAARYPVDGIHLDFIRYPGVIWGLPDNDEAAVLAGIDANTVTWCNLVRYGRLDFIERWLVWRAWRMTRDRQWNIAKIVNGIGRTVASHALRKDCQLSAAVFANPALFRYSFAQNWTEWERAAFFPVVMSYTPDIKLFTDYLKFTMFHRPDALMGIGLLWPDMQETAQWQKDATEKAAGAGVCYFDFAYLDTMIDQASWKSGEERQDTIETGNHQCESPTSIFSDLPPSGIVEKGRRSSSWGNDLNFAAFLLSLSLDPTSDLERMAIHREDFLHLVAQDVAAFEYMDREIFPLGDELLEPPKRYIRYHHIPWSQGDSLELVEQANNTLDLDQSAVIYPKSGDPLIKAAFQAQPGSREILFAPAGIYVFTVDSTHRAERAVKRVDLPPELLPVFINWTIKAQAMAMLSNNN
jgi:uncharacterized lipoprotein YddW (UPF0748 family)